MNICCFGVNHAFVSFSWPFSYQFDQYIGFCFIIRMKSLGLSNDQLLDWLQKQVLSVLWFRAPAWYFHLAQYKKKDENRVAKVGLRIIYGKLYSVLKILYSFQPGKTNMSVCQDEALAKHIFWKKFKYLLHLKDDLKDNCVAPLVKEPRRWNSTPRQKIPYTGDIESLERCE